MLLVNLRGFSRKTIISALFSICAMGLRVLFHKPLDRRIPFLNNQYLMKSKARFFRGSGKYSIYGQWDFQGPRIMALLTHTIPIRIPKDMGIVWEAYQKVPIMGSP